MQTQEKDLIRENSMKQKEIYYTYRKTKMKNYLLQMKKQKKDIIFTTHIFKERLKNI